MPVRYTMPRKEGPYGQPTNPPSSRQPPTAPLDVVVASRDRVSEHMLRLTLGGTDPHCHRRRHPGVWVKLVVDEPDGSGEHCRAYTVRGFDPVRDEISIDVFLHGLGTIPAGHRSAQSGQGSDLRPAAERTTLSWRLPRVGLGLRRGCGNSRRDFGDSRERHAGERGVRPHVGGTPHLTGIIDQVREHVDRQQACEPQQIHRGLRVTSAPERAMRVRSERQDVARPNEIAGPRAGSASTFTVRARSVAEIPVVVTSRESTVDRIGRPAPVLALSKERRQLERVRLRRGDRCTQQARGAAPCIRWMPESPTRPTRSHQPHSPAMRRRQRASSSAVLEPLRYRRQLMLVHKYHPISH